MKYVEGYTSGENPAPKNDISTSDLIHFSGNWIWRAVEALAQSKDFNSNPAWISDRLNISAEAAKDALEGLERIGLLRKDGESIIGNPAHVYSNSDKLDRSDLYEIHNKMKSQIDSKMNSRQAFSNTILLSNKKYVSEFYEKFISAVDELNSKSSQDSSCSEVFAFELSLARLSREKV
jgi:hypothetical protein